MRTRITSAIAAVLFVLFVAGLTACSAGDADERATGIPAEPTGAERTALIAALEAINPALVTDEDKAIDNARDQCSTLGGGDADGAAKARFSTSDHEVTAAEATAINETLLRTLC
jgi:hypothetical protein